LENLILKREASEVRKYPGFEYCIGATQKILTSDIKIRNRTSEFRNKILFLRRDKGSFSLQFSGAFSMHAVYGFRLNHPFIFILQ